MWPFSRDTTMSRRTRSAMEANIVNLSKVTKNLTEVLQHLETQEVLDLFDLSLIVSHSSVLKFRHDAALPEFYKL